uniref:Prostaglandin E synthase 2 n=1 Tax=Salix viminalis TaxID=40686 RepID=A0A6N2LH75_SALVM
MRRASTLASSVLSRTITSTLHDCSGLSTTSAPTINHRFLHAALFGTTTSTGSSNTRRVFNPFSTSLGVAGALVSVYAVASLSQEVLAKEPPPAELVPKEVVLYQYEACPFCNKVKAYLDYYDIPYKVVEVNPISKKEIKWSDYKKVPILLVDGEQLVDSSAAIIDKLGNKIHGKEIVDSASDKDDDEEKKWRRVPLSFSPNLHVYISALGLPPQVSELVIYISSQQMFLCYLYQTVNLIMLKIRNENLFDLDALVMAALFGENLALSQIDCCWVAFVSYTRWVDNHLVHVLSPNIYRNTSEALESFEYITNNGNFSFTERITVKYAGAAAMYFVSKNLKKKYNITDERAALYEAVETWVDALNGREFLGGSKPNLADLAVFGVLRPIRYLRSGRDMVEQTRIGDWYTRMENAVGESSRMKA